MEKGNEPEIKVKKKPYIAENVFISGKKKASPQRKNSKKEKKKRKIIIESDESDSLSESSSSSILETKVVLRHLGTGSGAPQSTTLTTTATITTTTTTTNNATTSSDAQSAVGLLEKAMNNKAMYPDIKFKIGKDHKIYAHKVILVTASSVFKKKIRSSRRALVSK